MTRRQRNAFAICSLLLFCVVFTAPSYAGDGVIEINQAKALAGGVTAGDAEGFPVTISESGSFRLTGNLTVPDENTTAIVIAAERATLDLNGFSIVGPVTCSLNLPTSDCGPIGSGRGIDAGITTRVRIRNGLIQGMGAEGIFATGTVSIEGVSVRFSGGNGIQAGGIIRDCEAGRNGGDGFSGGGSLLSVSATGNVGNGIVWRGVAADSTARFNSGDGIVLVTGVVRGNFVENNFGDGIEVTGMNAGSLLEGNTVQGNGDFGLRLGGTAGYAGNVIVGNSDGTVDGGVEIGTNVCQTDTTCP